jgi:hypothetical protein
MRKTIAILALAGAASAAQANAILSFGFTDLSGSFNSGTSVFTATGVAGGAFQTAGSVNRLQAPIGNAQYDPGSAAGLVSLSLAVSGVGPVNATGVGSITIMDADGDSFTSNITGTFTLNGGAVFFNGLMPNPALVAGANTNNMFDGPSGGSFPLTFAPAPGPYTGAVVTLYFDPGTFFSQTFGNIPTNLNGSVIPAPGALALLGVGGLVAVRRRRS